MNPEKFTNEQLVTRIQTGGDRSGEATLMLWKQNQGIIQQHVKKYQTRAEYEDLCQESFIALCSAVENYNGKLGSFISYLCYWLRQRLHRYCEGNMSMAHVPFHRYELLRKIRSVSADFEQTFFREPTRKELQGMLGVSESDLDYAILAEIAGKSTSLSRPIGSDDDEEITLGDTIPSEENLEDDAIEKQFQEEMRQAVQEELRKLDADQAEAITLVYLEGMTLEKAGEAMHRIPNQVRTLIEKGFRQLRRKPARRLRPYICDEAIAIAYKSGYGNFKMTWTSSTERAALKNMDRQGSLHPLN